jgi:hypothetical protein
MSGDFAVEDDDDKLVSATAGAATFEGAAATTSGIATKATSGSGIVTADSAGGLADAVSVTLTDGGNTGGS